MVGGLLSPEIKVSALKNCARLFKGAQSHVDMVGRAGDVTLSIAPICFKSRTTLLVAS